MLKELGLFTGIFQPQVIFESRVAVRKQDVAITQNNKSAS